MCHHGRDVQAARGDEVERGPHVGRRPGVGVDDVRPVLPDVEERKTVGDAGIGRCVEDDHPAAVHAPKRLVDRGERAGAHDDDVRQPAGVALPDPGGHVLVRSNGVIGAVPPRALEPMIADVRRHDGARAQRPGQLDVEDPRDPAPQHRHAPARHDPGEALGPDDAGEGLHEGPLLVAHVIGEVEGPALDVDRG